MCFLEESYGNIQKKLNFENFDSTIYSTSVSMPLRYVKPKLYCAVKVSSVWLLTSILFCGQLELVLKFLIYKIVRK